MVPAQMVSQFSQIFDNAANMVFVKDQNLHFHYYNHAFCKSFEIEHNELLLKTDASFAWQENGEDYNEHDRATLAGENYYQLEYLKSKKGNRSLCIAHKRTLADANGNVYGILGESHNLPENQLKQILDVHRYWMGSNLKIKIQPNLPPNESQLTPRELECLYHLLSGSPVKTIAYKLKLSPRTVECYVDSIKRKWHCYSKAEIIQKAFEGKYVYLSSEMFREVVK